MPNQDFKIDLTGRVNTTNFADPNKEFMKSVFPTLPPYVNPNDTLFDSLIKKPVLDADVTGQKQLPEGMEAVKPSSIPQPVSTPSLNNEAGKNLLNETRKIGGGIGSFTLADGTTVTETRQPLPGSDTDNLPVRSGASINVDRPGALPVAEDGKSFFSKVGDFITSPTFRAMLAQAGAAVGAGSPGVESAAGFAMQLAQSDAGKMYKKALEEGRDPETEKDAGILTHQMKRDIQADYEKKKSAKVTEDYTRQMMKESEARVGGILPLAEKKRQFEISSAITKYQLKQDNIKDIGQGRILDISTNTVYQAYDYQTGSSGEGPLGKFNSSVIGTITGFNDAVFLNMAMANKRAKLLKLHGPDYVKLIDLSKDFKNDDGTTNTQAITSNLTPEQAKQYGNELMKYTQDFYAGAPPTVGFNRQLQTGVGALEQEQDANTKVTPEGYVIRYDPKTNKWIRIR